MKKFILNDLRSEWATICHSDKLDNVFLTYNYNDDRNFDLSLYKTDIVNKSNSYGVTDLVDTISNFTINEIEQGHLSSEDLGLVGELINCLETDGVVLINSINDNGKDTVIFYSKHSYTFNPADFDEFDLEYQDDRCISLRHNKKEYYCLSSLFDSFVNGTDSVLICLDTPLFKIEEATTYSNTSIEVINEYKVFNGDFDYKMMGYSISELFNNTPALREFTKKYMLDYNKAKRDRLSWIDFLVVNGPVKFFDTLYSIYDKYGKNVEVHPKFKELLESHNDKDNFAINFYLDKGDIIAFVNSDTKGDYNKALQDALVRYNIEEVDGEIKYNGRTIIIPETFEDKIANIGYVTIGEPTIKREIIIEDEVEDVEVDSKETTEQDITKKKRPRIKRVSTYNIRKGDKINKNFPRRNESIFNSLYVQDIVYSILESTKYSDLTLDELVMSFDEKEIKLFENMKNINDECTLDFNVDYTHFVINKDDNKVICAYVYDTENKNIIIETIKADLITKFGDSLKMKDCKIMTKVACEKAGIDFSEENIWTAPESDGILTEDTLRTFKEEVNDVCESHKVKLMSLNESEEYDSSYTHFVIHKDTNTIIDAYDYSDTDKEDITHFTKIDLKDKFGDDIKMKDCKIMTRKACEKAGISLTFDNAFEMINENEEFTTLSEEDLTNAVNSYINCALWVEELEDSDIEVDKEEIKRISDDIVTLYSEAIKLYSSEKIDAAFKLEGKDVLNVVGHDFYLSRNGHGAGFFDNNDYDKIDKDLKDSLQEIADKLNADDYFIITKSEIEDEEEVEQTMESQIINSDLGKKVILEMVNSKEDLSDATLEGLLGRLDTEKLEKLYESINKKK